ncbi:DEAD/DEAH box helicase [Bosea sp. RAC05]|uniref:DEAD/DEAH box helicase n=1 Tax=Bosea sp. RAC05 TaxID=1842539 RepID=UPI00083D4E5D|nr:DEAD/DEAH box helicase [Bosea sp. RAC05]AOG03028.1 putative aTP-dependent helicase yeeB [Bosea sp. RAC05]
MPNLVNVAYAQTGTSKKTNAMGMREMQARVFEHRNAQFLLVKAPPASGKSRALMFVGLDKLRKQGVKKVIVGVPERSIGASFASTRLTEDGFYADWHVKPEWNLCTSAGNSGKVPEFIRFLSSPDEVLVCTHATLRFAYEKVGAAAFENVCLAVDEFHHASADEDSRLGELVRALLQNKDTHIVAMTGSYFRGDANAILRPDDEMKFSRVTYTYYEQLSGYNHLRTLGIGYHFYRGRYTDVIGEVINGDLKTIIHIPSVQSGESTKDKYIEIDRILDHIGDVVGDRDPATGLYHVREPSGRVLKVADLVTEEGRDLVMATIRGIKAKEDLDIIIALGMAKEGFDWVWCEHALTVGYRGSLTEVIQIIGRVTRDAEGKSHAQFTNLIAEPDAAEEKVTGAVNNMLKAIACSLLMEQVLAPVFKFKARRDGDDVEGHRQDKDGDAGEGTHTIKITGFREASTERSRQIIATDLNDLKAAILQNETIMRAAMDPNEFAPEVINKVFIPTIIEQRYPDLTPDEVEEVRQHVVVDTVIKKEAVEGGDLTGTSAKPDDDSTGTGGGGGGGRMTGDEDPGGSRFVQMADRFVNIDELHIDLIDAVNPFQRAYEVLSKSVTASVLQRIHDSIRSTKIAMTEAEAVLLYDRIVEFKKAHGTMPNLQSVNPMEKRMAEAVLWLQNEKMKRKREAQAV